MKYLRSIFSSKISNDTIFFISAEPGKYSLERVLKSLEELHLISPESIIIIDSGKLSQEFLNNRLKVVSQIRKKKCRNLIYFQEDKKNVKNIRKIKADRIFTVDRYGLLHLEKGYLDSELYPALNHNIFSRLGPKLDESFRYFPYNHQYIFALNGPCNQFGFRTALDFSQLSIRDRKRHKVIAVFGGSSVVSVFCHFKDTMTEQLEKLLNCSGNSRNQKIKVNVLNFGLSGGHILNDLINFVLYVDLIKPDIIISHAGYNDLSKGLISDPRLLKESQISYLLNLEHWSQILHKSMHIDRPYNTLKYDQSKSIKEVIPINLPSQSIQAYISRIEQFEHFVMSRGIHFIHGLQPIVDSKKGYSKDEEIICRKILKTSRSRNILEKLLVLFDNCSTQLLKSKIKLSINIHRKFIEYDSTDELFGDHVHTNSEGDYKIAMIYNQYIDDNELLFKSIRGEKL